MTQTKPDKLSVTLSHATELDAKVAPQSAAAVDAAIDRLNAEGLMRQLARRLCDCPFPNPGAMVSLHSRWCRYRFAMEREGV